MPLPRRFAGQLPRALRARALTLQNFLLGQNGMYRKNDTQLKSHRVPTSVWVEGLFEGGKGSGSR